jgi:hypothetical protein
MGRAPQTPAEELHQLLPQILQFMKALMNSREVKEMRIDANAAASLQGRRANPTSHAISSDEVAAAAYRDALAMEAERERALPRTQWPLPPRHPRKTS